MMAPGPADARVTASASPAFLSEPSRPEPALALLYAGSPAFVNGAAVLFDSGRPEDAGKLTDSGRLTRLRGHFPGGSPSPGSLDPGLALLLYVDDLSLPRARVRLVDLLRQGGERPLNLSRRPGQRVRIELVDPAGAWASGAPVMEVALA